MTILQITNALKKDGRLTQEEQTILQKAANTGAVEYRSASQIYWGGMDKIKALWATLPTDKDATWKSVMRTEEGFYYVFDADGKGFAYNSEYKFRAHLLENTFEKLCGEGWPYIRVKADNLWTAIWEAEKMVKDFSKKSAK